jgi:hypothetical protein
MGRIEDRWLMRCQQKRGRMILKCNCKNDYQDKLYGTGNRVHNPIKVSSTQLP